MELHSLLLSNHSALFSNASNRITVEDLVPKVPWKGGFSLMHGGDRRMKNSMSDRACKRNE